MLDFSMVIAWLRYMVPVVLLDMPLCDEFGQHGLSVSLLISPFCCSQCLLSYLSAAAAAVPPALSVKHSSWCIDLVGSALESTHSNFS